MRIRKHLKNLSIRLKGKRLVIFLIIFSIFFMPITGSINNVYADENKSSGKEAALNGFVRDGIYADYIDKFKDAPRPDKEIVIKGTSYVAKDNADIRVLNSLDGKKDVLEWVNESGSVEYEVDIPETGLYNLALNFYPLQAKGREIELGLAIDGKYPFDSANSFRFTRVWRDKEAIKKDNRDNELRPKQEEVQTWQEMNFVEGEGLYNDPLQFHFTKGKHKIRLYLVREAVAIDYIKIYQAKLAIPYKEASEIYKQQGYNPSKNFLQKIQAEKPYTKSHEILYPMYDRSTPATEPSDPSKVRLNTIGQLNWKYPGQWIAWKIDVPEDGLYCIGLKARQNFLRGMFTTRKISIDGKVPFKELEKVAFPYSANWYMKTLGDQEPYRIFLTKGTHEIKMEVVLGDLAETLRNIDKAVYELNYLYRKIIMVTGTVPDAYRDYYLDAEIPNLLNNFKYISDSLKKEEAYLNTITGIAGSEGEFLKELAAQLDSFVADPDTITRRLDRYKSNVSSLASWVLRLKQQPLELDYLVVYSPQKALPKANAGLLSQTFFDLRAFIASFFENYNSIGNAYDNSESLNVWISSGRDQAQVLKSMIDDMFTSKTGIKVNLSIVDTGATLIQATLGGKGPDVALNVPKSDPINLAMRGALVDLSKFKDFDTVTQQFQKSAMIPYMYRGGCYALPETQNYNVVFYRKDIFQELGIKVPNTWEEFYAIIPVIQKNNMQIGVPDAQIIFETLLFQHGGKFYKDDHRTTGFDQAEALSAFKEWTGFFTKYSFPLVFDFFNRFRTGEMPMGIQPYVMSNQLSIAAPELRNLWGMAPVPGIRQPDGTIRRNEGANGNASIILKDAKNKEAAYEFLKWWTSTEAQARFGIELESIMGPGSRYDTANIEAFKKLPWSRQETEILMEQWRHVWDVPQLPGNYYAARSLTNAFRKVVYSHENPREVLFEYNDDINRELERKRVEFGLDK